MTSRHKETYLCPLAEELPVELSNAILEASSLENPVDGGEWDWK